jgi:hypothetical protein
MLTNVRKLLCTGLLFGLLAPVSAQIQDPSQRIQHIIDLFGAKNKGVWIHLYSGIGSNGEPYLLTLGYDLTSYKGLLEQTSQQQSYYVEGRYHPEDFKLVVQDEEWEHKGFLLAQVNRSGLKARFMDPGKSTGIYIEFEKTPRDGFAALQCPARRWYKTLTGIMDQTAVLVQLQSDTDQRIYGTVSTPDKLTGFMVSGDCVDPACERMKLRLHDYFGERIKEFQLEKKSGRQFAMVEMFKDRYPIEESWELAGEHPMVCKNISLPGIRIYAEYLQTGDRDFDLWISGFLDQWSGQVVHYHQQSVPEQTQHYSVFTDVEWVHRDWVSGIFRFSEPWSEGDRNLAFTYDRKAKRIVSLEDCFEKEFDYTKYFEEFISWKKQEMMSVNSSGRFRMYLEHEPFKNWTLRPEGFCFSSDFNRIWGMRKIIIPYALLEQHVRKLGPLRKLY